MRTFLLVAGAALGILVVERAAAQDVPPEPPAEPVPPPAEPAPPPAEPAPPPAEPAPPPAEPAPPPAEPVPPPAEPAPPPAEPAPPPAEPAPPPTAAPPPPPPPVAPPREVAPAAVTLEEAPEGSAPAQRARPKTKLSPAESQPRPRRTEPRPSRPVEQEPTPDAERPAPPPPADETPDAAAESKEDEEDDDGDGVLGPFRIGPLVGVGLPSVVSFGGIIKLTRYLGAGVNIGLIPAIKVSLYGDAELSYQEYDIYGRLFPFGGMVFLGAGVGYATMEGSFRTSQSTTAYQNLNPPPPNPLSIVSDGSVKTMVLTPAIGLLHTFGSGFTLGLDVGAQIPIAPSVTKYKTRVPASVPQELVDKYVTPNDKKVQDTLDTVGRTILPTLNFRIGWLL